MDGIQLSDMFHGWNTSGSTGQCALGPVYALENTKNSAKRASALVISVPGSRQQLQQMRASGMDDKQIMLQLRSEVDALHSKCSSRSIPGLLRCSIHGQQRHTDDLGWDVGILTEPVVPLSMRMDLVSTEAQIRRFAETAAATLDACQKQGISVGTLTPDRIFATPDGEFRLTDLGSSGAAVPDTTALGLLLHWLLSGQMGPVPTAGTPLAELTGPDPSLCALVMQAARGGFSSAAELLHQLQQLSSGISGSPRPKKKGLLLGIAAAIIVAIILLLLRACDPQPTTGTEPTDPISTTEPTVLSGWSDWVDVLPEEVTADDHLIQERPMYRVQVLENTSSITDTALEGWTFVETVDERGEFLDWSEWADTIPEENPDREIETALRYRTKTKETTTASTETKDGWTRYDSSSQRTNFGSWGSWSTDKVSNTETRDTESKKQYRYRDKEYTTSEKSSLDGWTQYDAKHQYGEWGSWSGWSDEPISETDTRAVQTRQVEIPGKTTYIYGAYFSSNSPKVSSTFSYACGTCAKQIYGGDWSYKTVTSETRARSSSISFSCAHRSTRNRYHVGPREYYYETIETTPTTYKTQYSYRTRTKNTTYYYSRWGGWSDWGDSKPSAADGRETQDRTVYRSRSCVTVYTHHFYRWTSWSDWTETAASSNSTTEVETKTVYRYRDREIIPTHYFVRWSDWGEYTTSFAAPSETQHVESLLQLRYCLREQEDAPQEWLFTDITQDGPYSEAIRWGMDRGIIKGTSDTTFTPAGTFTRRQMAIMFWRALSYPEPMNQQMTLTDMTVADPYRKAINWAVESGIADAVVPGTFGSEELCTRGDFILALYRAAGCPAVTLAQEPFDDVDPEMPVYNAVLWSYERGISHGLTTTQFGIDQPCTRLQAVMMLHKALDLPAAPAEPAVPAESTAPTE